MPLGVAAGFLIFSNVRLFKIRATAHQQQFEGIACAASPVELHSRTGGFAEVIQFVRLRRIEVTARSKPVSKKVISQPAPFATVIRIQVILGESRSPEVHAAVSLHGRAGASGDIQNTPEAIAVLRSEAASHEIDGLKNLRADSG